MKRRGPVLVFLWALALSACADQAPTDSTPGGKRTTVKVAFWGTPEEIEIVTNSIKSWQDTHPEIAVRFEHTPFAGYTSKILTRVAGGAAPDIIATEVNMFVSFAAKGVLEDLAPFAVRDPSFSIDDFFPEVVHRFTVGGKLFAIPRDTAPFACVYYNKNLFDEAKIPYPSDDWTWDDLLRTAKALTKTDDLGRVTQYGFYGWAWQNFVYGAGGSFVDRIEYPTRCLLDSTESKLGLQFYTDLTMKYKVMPAPVALVNMGMGVDIMFASGRLAMFLSGIWETPALRTRNFRWDVAMFPVGPSGIRRFGTGGTGYAILKSSKHKKEAWEVLKALTGPAGQEELGRRGLAQPARRAVSEGPAFAANDNPPANKAMLNQAVKYVVYEPFHDQWREIQDKVMSPELDLLFNGKQTVDQTVSKIVGQVNALLAKEES